MNEVTGLCGCDRIAAASPISGDAPVPLPADFYRGNHGLRAHYDLIIVGAGLSGCIFAERASREFGKSCLVIDKRDHIGGNCYDYIDEHGFRVSQCVPPTSCFRSHRSFYLQVWGASLPHQIRPCLGVSQTVLSMDPIRAPCKGETCHLSAHNLEGAALADMVSQARLETVDGDFKVEHRGA